MKLDTDKPKQQKTQTQKLLAKRRLNVAFHKFDVPTKTLKEQLAASRIPSNIKGIDRLIGPGWPAGGMINLVSFPKAGKSTLIAHEAMGYSKAGKEVLIYYNEEPKVDYLTTFDGHRRDLRYKEEDLKMITFGDAHGQALEFHKYDYIRKMANMWVVQPIDKWLSKGHKPIMVAIDSLTRYYRTAPAQSFEFVSTVTYGLKVIYKVHGVRPVTFIVHQKASSGPGSDRDDERGFGGWGNIHEMDGSVVIQMREVDTWFERDTGLPRGTTQRFIKGNFRQIRAPEIAFHYIQHKTLPRVLEVGTALPDMISNHRASKYEAEARGPGE